MKTSSLPVELFGFAKPVTSGAKRQRLLDLGDIDAAHFQNRAGAEIHSVEHEPLDLVLRFGAGAGHETRAHAKSARSKPKVETGGLNLAGPNRDRRGNIASLDQGRDCL